MQFSTFCSRQLEVIGEWRFPVQCRASPNFLKWEPCFTTDSFPAEKSSIYEQAEDGPRIDPRRRAAAQATENFERCFKRSALPIAAGSSNNWRGGHADPEGSG